MFASLFVSPQPSSRAWPGLTAVAVDVTAHEAIGGYRLQNIATCP